MWSSVTSASLRTKLLGIALLGAVLPLALVGLWLANSTQRVGEELLRSRIDATLIRASREVGARWISHRSALLDVAEDPTVRRIMGEDRAVRGRPLGGVALPSLREAFAGLRAATTLIVLRDAAGKQRWILAADAAGSPMLAPAADSLRIASGSAGDALPVSVEIRDRARAGVIGAVEARFRTAAIVPAVNGSVVSGGAVVAVMDRNTGSIVAPLPFDAALLRRGRFEWGGEEWLTDTRLLEDPYIEILAAAPLTGFTLPFQHAARTGIVALLAVALVGFIVVTVLTRRVTQSLVELSVAADAVSQGDLERRVPTRTRDEVGRLAHAFNLMTDSLRRTLAELSQRQAVAAVGEFASALAHEIRNPLSAIRLNLQHVEELLDENGRLRAPVAHALRDIARLEGTVASALRLARTGHMHMETLSLRIPLESAARSADPELRRRGIQLETPVESLDGIEVRGNAAALEQVFLNLLLNGADAAGSGGRVRVVVDHDATTTAVAVWDNGSGFSAEARERAFEAFFTTKPEGSGFGLTVARRIAIAHGGALEIESGQGAGTSVRLRLPRLASTTVAPRSVAARGNATVHGS